MTPIEPVLMTQPVGRVSPLMSSGSGFARPSPFTSLQHSPDALSGLSSIQSQSGAVEGWPGALRSEVKEEARSEAVPGDMSAVKHPVGLTIEKTLYQASEQP